MTANVVAKLAYETARAMFDDSRKRQGKQKPEKLALRLKNLLPEEVEELLDIWTSEAEGDELGIVRLLLAHDADVRCDARFLADPDKAITWYRNRNADGLIYVQTKVESDEQGLEFMFTIQDRNYLDGSLKPAFDAESRLIEIAWELAGGNRSQLPRNVIQSLVSVREALQLGGVTVPVRSFAAFALEVSNSLLHGGRRAFDETDVRIAIGRALPALGFFPDEGWEKDGQAERRLLVNYRIADLMDPSGLVDQDPDDLFEKIATTDFHDEDGEALGAVEAEQCRDACRAFVSERSEGSRRGLNFWVYHQVFATDRVRGALGDRVREELLGRDASRVVEFDDLEVHDALNRREQEAALRFVEAEVDGDSPSLLELLKPKTQEVLRKLAHPRDRRFTNPLTRIVEVIRGFDRDELEGARLEIRCGRMREDPSANASVGLFAFLFGRCLSDLAAQSALDPSGVQLTVDPVLIQTQKPPALKSDTSGAGEADDGESAVVPVPTEWNGVPIEIRLRPSTGGDEVLFEDTNLRWRPDDINWLAFGWLLVAADDSPKKSPILDLPSGDFGQLVQDAVTRLTPISDFVSARTDPTATQEEVLSDIAELRSDFWSIAAGLGLELEAIDSYVEAWANLLADARSQFVPNGALDPRLQVLLSIDVIHSANGPRALMLFSHPMRLRWFAHYRRELMKVCAAALDRDLHLNSVNEDFYIDALEHISPHGYPPLLANCSRTLMVPVSEHGLSEEYAAIQHDGQLATAWKVDLDDSALGELARQVESYLRAHPHKVDGIRLAFVLPAGGTVPQRLIEAIRRRDEWKSVPIACTVVAPKSSWDQLIEKFEELETESRVGGAIRLSPPLQLELADWTNESAAAKLLEGREFDISMVPNFFGDQVAVDEYSEAPIERTGSVNLLHDDSTYADRGSAAGAVSIVLRPEPPDPVMDDWSTVNVRLLRRGAIAPNTPKNIDYVKLNIRFEEAGDLFATLHDSSHWVVTLDRYIGRHQIESLEKRPDVLTVRESVGQSGLFTLVVSSNAGRKFVVDRLGVKLERISSAIPNLDWQSLATNIYDEIRVVAPSLILRSMGISRVTEEVLGIMVAKRVTESSVPAPPSSSTWISLDEHSDWFGGDGAIRADLCRVDLFRDGDGRLQIGLVAVEGKLRQAYDAHGERQASRTAELLRDALAIDSERGRAPSDALFWRHAIVAAVREASSSADGEDGDDTVFDDVTRDEILTGQFDLAYCRAVYSICMYGRRAPLATRESQGVSIIESSANEILNLIEGDLAELRVAAGFESTAEAREVGREESRPAETGQKADTPTAETESNLGERNPEPEGSVGMSEERLTQYYQLILDTLREFKVEVLRPDDGKPLCVEGPAFMQFRVRPGRGVDPKRINACEGALRLALSLEEGKLLRFPIGGGTVNIEVPKEESDRYYVSAEELWQRWTRPNDEVLTVPIGVNQRNEIVAINFSSPNSPHLLIGGTTGSGKSEALNTILHGLTRYFAPEQLRLVLIDPKQTELQTFEESPHLLGRIGYFDDDAVQSLSVAVAEMNQRYALFRTRGARDLPQYNAMVGAGERLPWHVVVLDEYADLVSEPEARREIEGSVKRLSQKARACGIHLIIATQKPSAENISTTVRSNLPAQLGLRCRSSTESRIILDEAGAETLNGKGDAFLKVADKIERIQCARVEQTSQS
jgi:S-DNA-T family DNA segregation ATPase FtsK/SpoIIIE